MILGFVKCSLSLLDLQNFSKDRLNSENPANTREETKEQRHGSCEAASIWFVVLLCRSGDARGCSSLEWAPWAPCQVENRTQVDPVWGPGQCVQKDVGSDHSLPFHSHPELHAQAQLGRKRSSVCPPGLCAVTSLWVKHFHYW